MDVGVHANYNACRLYAYLYNLTAINLYQIYI